ncbi:SAM-dependent methyltransferase [Actinokineospora pegani]|uniref:SAM-dependent methyltransferase n=1 Tax=Actinokineospora pegani TaxID=2654637 RepID=UPI0012EA3E4D|nr:SAM-dependent methyltransferase [Actinokineospora pegani]
MPFEHPHGERRRAVLDLDVPTQARVADALVGGRDNYAVDRELVDRLLRLAPEASTVAREHRAFVARALRTLVRQFGVDQFVDLGAGMPIPEETHRIVQRHNPEARVVYLDNDPIVVATGRALLEENERTHVVDADLSDPETALYTPGLALLDRTRPIALILADVLPHIDDDTTARETVTAWLDAVPPGSYLVLTHHHDPADGGPASALAQAIRAEFHGTPVATKHRTRPQIEAFLQGLTPLPPGLVPLHTWWPDGPRETPVPPLNLLRLGAVAMKP